MPGLGDTESIQDWGAHYVIGGAGILGSGVCWGRTVFDKLPVSQSSGGFRSCHYHKAAKSHGSVREESGVRRASAEAGKQVGPLQALIIPLI